MTTEQAETMGQSVDKSGEKVQNMFAQIAPRYDLLNHLLSLGIDIRWRNRTVRELRLDGELPILDCCTGTGDLAIALSRKVNGQVKVIGTDFCLPMLEIAREKHDNSKSERPIEFLEADAQNLPFDDSSFQTVTVAFGLRNVQDYEKGLAEMVRVCAPGGQVAILEFSRPGIPGLKQAYEAYFRYVLPKVGQSLAKNEASAYNYLPNSVMQFPSGIELAEKMEAAGLSAIKIIPLTFGISTLYIGEKEIDETAP